jgi:uncharacterized membrane protein
MADKVPQTLANHARYDPLFHFFLAPLALVLLIWAVTHLVRHPNHESVAWVVVSVLLFLGIFKTRTYALKVQDRVIRLEEKLRLASLLPAGAVIPVLTEGQLVALRFASDAELPALAEKAAAGNLTGKQIKEAIQSWRADYWRV